MSEEKELDLDIESFISLALPALEKEGYKWSDNDGKLMIWKGTERYVFKH